MKRKSRLRIKGNQRGLMFICKDIRRRWLQYGENRKLQYNKAIVFVGIDKGRHCDICKQFKLKDQLDIDHIKPVGSRPRKWEDLGKYAEVMFERQCQALCKSCHKQKTDGERKRRKK